jgi:exodeoxyribonuclease V alpha subunit
VSTPKSSTPSDPSVAPQVSLTGDEASMLDVFLANSLEKAQINRGGDILRVGDRVIQLKNDYEREVFNGDLGVVGTIDSTEHEVMIQYEGRAVIYDYADLNELGLAWSISIHKSQGSEYPVVILPLYMQHYLLLSRNLVYTGLTRAKKLAIVVGSKKAIGLAVRQNQVGKRYTRLPARPGACTFSQNVQASTNFLLKHF